MCDEIRLAVDIFKLSRDELWEIISNGFQSSFMPGSYANKLVSWSVLGALSPFAGLTNQVTNL